MVHLNPLNYFEHQTGKRDENLEARMNRVKSKYSACMRSSQCNRMQKLVKLLKHTTCNKLCIVTHRMPLTQAEKVATSARAHVKRKSSYFFHIIRFIKRA
uniref:Uncharacterized protein n=1 Tax=Physcomitrium patens TaxID=3218 RepID=A0A2K1JUK3_PHYPA|nr:hypothetical protein PHYPA_014957 [Physcomitrium patens]